MKLSGNKKNGRYAPGRKQNHPLPADKSVEAKTAGATVKRKSSNRVIKIVIAILAVILALLVIFYIFLKAGLRPPDVNNMPKPTNNGDAASVSGAQTVPPVRDKTKYTFVILGMDDGNGNSDTMMAATFDDTSFSLNVVSIPRDTLINVSWPVKKANSLYAYGDMEGVIDGLTDLLGYQVDYYVKVDLDAFSKLVNAVGGVDFDVPKDMNYDDDAQDLRIHLEAGPQQLDGDKALQLVRARTNVWANGDIGRIETQQAFLKAAAEQILAKKESIKVKVLIDIILNDVETNLTALDMTWFALEFFKMDAENISFDTIPAKYDDLVNGASYCTVKLDEWLNLINTKLTPFDFEVKAEDVSILTRDTNGNLYVTDGVWAGKN